MRQTLERYLQKTGQIVRELEVGEAMSSAFHDVRAELQVRILGGCPVQKQPACLWCWKAALTSIVASASCLRAVSTSEQTAVAARYTWPDSSVRRADQASKCRSSRMFPDSYTIQDKEWRT